ncbi:MAG: hypothetical protein FWD11_00205, partial [Micrococcales bacterium]|nr:hypothetical protein [Micrococcales bacterium]
MSAMLETISGDTAIWVIAVFALAAASIQMVIRRRKLTSQLGQDGEPVYPIYRTPIALKYQSRVGWSMRVLAGYSISVTEHRVI